MIRRSCSVCGADTPRGLLVDQGVPIARCRTCGFIYCMCIPDTDELEDHYAQAYADSEAWLQKMQQSRRWVFEHGLDTLKKLGACGYLLDVGCSVGLFLNAARAAGFCVQGIELSPAPAQLAREKFGLEVWCGRLEESPWPAETFDVVTLWDVLEHLPDPRQTLTVIARLLRPGGWISLRVPDGEFHLLKTRLVRPWLGHRVTWMEVPNHLNHFRPRTLTRLLAETGFEVRHVCPGPPHFWGRPIDHFKTAYYRMADAFQRTLGWQIGNAFEAYARKSDE